MSKNVPEVTRHRSATGLLALAALLGLGAALVYAAQATLSSYVVTLLALMFLNIALAVSLTVTNGFAGLFSLGHPAFMTIGGYIAAVLTYPPARKDFMLPDLPAVLLPALLAGGIIAAILAFLVGLPVLRLKGHYLAVATLGLIVIVQGLATNWSGLTRGGSGLNGIPRLTNIWWCFGFAALAIYVALRLKFSSLGRAMMATRENAMAAESSGVSTYRVRMLAFVIGAFFAAVAGGLMVHLITVVTPKTYSVVLAFNLIAMVVIGGTGSVFGAILAAMALTGISEAARPLEENLNLYGLSQVIVALALILVLFFRPNGIMGGAEPRLLRRLF
jgi:branched-chain amino acid transport system permease protein